MNISKIRLFVGTLFFAFAGFIPGMVVGAVAGWEAHGSEVTAWYISMPNYVVAIVEVLALGMAALLIIPELRRER